MTSLESAELDDLWHGVSAEASEQD